MRATGESQAMSLDAAWYWERRRETTAVRTIMVITGIFFLVQWLTSRSRAGGEMIRLMSLYGDGLRSGYIWQPVTYMLLHGGPGHLLMNMLGLMFLGPEVERRLGKAHFTGLYLLCGILGGIGYVLIEPRYPCVGASGAVFGVMAAFAMLFPHRRMAFILFPFFTFAAWKMVLAIVGLELLYLVGGVAGGIAHAAHLAGAVAGVAYLRVVTGMEILPRWRRRPWPRRIGDWISPPRDEGRVGREELDRLLDKIASRGLASLTPRERIRLDQASREQRGE